jgi:hypothetical protein
MIGREYIATFEGKRQWNVTQDGNAGTGIIRGAAYIGVSHEEPDMPEERRHHPRRPLLERAVWLSVEPDEEDVTGVALTPATARHIAAALLHMAAWVERSAGEAPETEDP